MKKISLIILTICFVLFANTCSFAESTNIYLKSDKQIYEIGDLIKIAVFQNKNSISAFDFQLIFDENKLEYVKGEEETNLQGNKITFMWFDETGGNNPKIAEELVEFTFKAKQEGNANIAIIGNYYNKQGEELEANEKGISIKIGKQESEEENIKESAEEGMSNDVTTSKLQTLRISEEGLSPEFDKNITDYYFVANEEIEKIEVTAIPENPRETVTIIGNENLKEGDNTITIQVVSENKQSKTNYNIHVTKTSQIEKANTNLETLAIENEMLYPSFSNNITEYRVDVENDKEKIQILAVPEDIKANIIIAGESIIESTPQKEISIKEGKNIISIEVVAQNGITNKKIEITVYRRNKQEQQIYEQEQHENLLKKEELLKETASMQSNEKEIVNNNDKQNEIKKEEGTKMIWISIAIGMLVILIICIFINKYIINK